MEHDPLTLKAFWAVLAFSREEQVLDYFKDLILCESINKKTYLYYLFTIFCFDAIQHPYSELLLKFYEQKIPTLQSYQLAEKLNLNLIDKFNWTVMIILSNGKDCITTNQMSDEEKEKHYTLTIYFGSPFTLDSSYHITFQNSLLKKRKKLKIEEFLDSATTNVDESRFKNRNLLNLNSLLEDIEDYFKVNFDLDNPEYIYTTKGISRKTIMQWIKKRFK